MELGFRNYVYIQQCRVVMASRLCSRETSHMYMDQSGPIGRGKIGMANVVSVYVVQSKHHRADEMRLQVD
jgi:hypothetical protein